MKKSAPVLFMGQVLLYNKSIEKIQNTSIKAEWSKDMKNNKHDNFIFTDGYWLAMEAKRSRDERKKFIWDIEDDSYSFEEK